MQRHLFIVLGILLVGMTGAPGKKEPAVPAAMSTQKQLALVRVNVTGQSYDYFRPWQKKAPFSKRALGAVLSKGHVLVTADLVANQNYVELERAESGEKTAAKVEVIDYEANLALLEPTEKAFLDGIIPLEIALDTAVGDRLAAWQLERGFPSVGFSFFPTRDPELREFAGERGKNGGVYVTNVEPRTPAMKAGLQVGDIVKAVANNEIDQNGNYVDPLYGKIEFTNLLTAHAYSGDIVPFLIQRSGKPMELNVPLEHRDARDYVSPPYNLDQPPSYYVLGGLIFQELSRQYLKEWGANWQREAPQRFVYLDRFQSELFPEGNRRVVILSQVLPANSTIGYDDLSYLTVTKVNGKEIKSLGEDRK